MLSRILTKYWLNFFKCVCFLASSDPILLSSQSTVLLPSCSKIFDIWLFFLCCVCNSGSSNSTYQSILGLVCQAIFRSWFICYNSVCYWIRCYLHLHLDGSIFNFFRFSFIRQSVKKGTLNETPRIESLIFTTYRNRIFEIKLFKLFWQRIFCYRNNMKRYPKSVEDSYIGPALKKWRRRLRAAKSGHHYLYLESNQKQEQSK